MSDPAISVVMPVFNSERYLVEAIESILNQTFSDFEFLIFDDGSTDRSPEIIREYAERDGRITAVFSPTNRGHVVHLNEGIRRARGQYIARMDSDDVALPNRLEVQERFLTDHPEIGVVGSSTLAIDQDGRTREVDRRQPSPSYLFWRCFFTNPLSHPTVMYRKDAITSVGGYDETKMPSEDYELWSRLLPNWQLANIEEPLLKYRQHTQSVSVRNREIQVKSSGRCVADVWKRLMNIEVSGEEILFLREFHKGYDGLPGELVPTLFRKIWALRRMVLSRFTAVDDEVHRDAFRRGVYLATRVRPVSMVTFLQLLGYLAANYPGHLTKQILYGRVS